MYRDLLLFGFLVIVTYSGNASLFGFPLFCLGFLFFLFLFVFLTRDSVLQTPIDAIVSILITVSLVFATIKNADLRILYTDNFWVWPIFCLVAFIQYRLINNAKSYVGNKSLVIFVLFFFTFTFLALLFGKEVNGRHSFLFGPNNLYRIELTLYFLSFLYFNSNRSALTKRVRVPLQTLAFALVTYMLIKIGSRGGVVIFILFFFIYYFSLKSSLLFSMIGASLVVYLTDKLEGLRLFDFSFEGNARYMFIKSFLEITDPVVGSTYTDFDFAWYGHYLYPHNILLELYMYYGFTGLLLSVLLIISVIISSFGIYQSRKLMRFDNIYHVIFFIVFTGSLFSGDLTDNFIVISMVPIIISNFVINIRKKEIAY